MQDLLEFTMRLPFFGPRILGMRPGISLGPEDFRSRRRAAPQRAVSSIEGSFVYVIRGEHNLVKIGVSTNPDALASLRSASPFALDIVYTAFTPGSGYDIVAAAHEALKDHRCTGEWFDVAPEIAVGAIAGAAHKLGQPLQPIKPPPLPAAPLSLPARVLIWGVYAIGGLFVVAVAAAIIGGLEK
jgi:hypothetical protein